MARSGVVAATEMVNAHLGESPASIGVPAGEIELLEGRQLPQHLALILAKLTPR